MALKFGTSGVRGLVVEMTDQECWKYALAFARYVKQRTNRTGEIALAGDFRSSTPRILVAVRAGLAAAGFQSRFCGMIPTPAVAAYAMQRKRPCIMVTGSHIPDDRNGIKFYLPWGETLKPDEAEISAQYQNVKVAEHGAGLFDESGMFQAAQEPLGPADPTAMNEFIRRPLDFFPPAALAGMRVVVYQHSAVIRDALPEILRALGATVVEVGWSDRFVPVDTEAVAEPERLAEWVRHHKADALVSADGDSDRPLLVDERGKVIRGDVLGILVSVYLGVDVVATPVSCNTAVEACGEFKEVIRTRIGSPYVIAAMQKAAAADQTLTVVGYEANGGYLTGTEVTNPATGAVLPPLPTRDCVLPLLSALCAAHQAKRSLSEWVNELPPRFTCSGLLRAFPSEQGRAVLNAILEQPAEASVWFQYDFGEIQRIDATDGVRITFDSGRIVHFRPSGNAPEFRCYTEAESEAASIAANARALELLQQTICPAVAAKKKRSPDTLLTAALDRIEKAAGMDVIIVSTTSAGQEQYWQQRLEQTRGQVAREDAVIVVVHEDWPGGAGNGLGTLYALVRAANRMQEQSGLDLLEQLQNGAAVALYHTAGKGTRLAPLPAAEYNNKPGVCLPGLLNLGERAEPITILESVIRQTASYAPERKGRVSVFWGDQVFIPAAEPNQQAKHHADILARIGPMPDADEWQKRGLEKYGLVAVNAKGDAVQVEKITHQQAQDLIDAGVMAVDGGIGVSLGSFSISAPLTRALLDEFAPELVAKKGKLDSDPHFWMPLTLDEQTYLTIMAQKGEDPAFSRAHYRRMSAFARRFLADHPEFSLFGAVDIGLQSYWWDYGQLIYYYRNNQLLTRQTPEAAAMRRFFQISADAGNQPAHGSLDCDAHSIVQGCTIQSGRIRNSVLINVRADHIDVEDAVLIQVAAPAVKGKGCLLYRVSDAAPVQMDERAVRADVFLPEAAAYRFQTSLDRDGGADWYTCLPNNPMSYDEMRLLNAELDIVAAVEARRQGSLEF